MASSNREIAFSSYCGFEEEGGPSVSLSRQSTREVLPM